MNIIYAIEVSTPGASTPNVLYGKTSNKSDEPKYTNYLTALGSRQQYLVGSEYRLRYVEEALFLNYSYDISDIWIQTTFDSKNILSSQAQMHGLYPPYSNQNFLTEWQQRNAVPPLDNVLNDQWTAWQEELGNKALIDGFNTFPINVQGHEDDYLLRVTPDNCPKLQSSLASNWDSFYTNTTTTYSTFLTRLQTLSGDSTMNVTGAYNFCFYLKWADLHNIALTFNIITSDIDSCNSLINSFYNYVIDTDQTLGYISSNQFLLQTHDSLSTIAGNMSYHKTFFYLQNSLKEQQQYHLDERIRNNADDNPNFYFYLTDEINMRLMISGIQGSDNKKTSTVFSSASTPASNLIIELTYESDDTFYVQAYFNDEQIMLGGCTSYKCESSKFITYLASVATISDVPTTCQDTSSSSTEEVAFI